MTTLRVMPVLALLLSCGEKKPPVAAAPPTEAAPVLDRQTFNRLAAQLALPVFWSEDDGNGQPDPGELVLLNHGTWGPQPPPLVRDGQFTDAGNRAIERVQEVFEGGHPLRKTDEERARLAAIVKELDTNRPTLVHTDLSEHADLAGHMLQIAADIDRLHWTQNGGFAFMRAAVERGDDPSAALTWRNHGPWCLSNTSSDCHGDPGKAPRRVGVYPEDLQAQDGFCAELESKGLMEPFTVVRAGEDGALAAVPYSEAYAERMGGVARELEAVADGLPDEEKAFAAYLRAAAGAFRTNDWFAADAAWAEMNAENSDWYLRIGPDETYWDPCNRKAGFHMVFAKVNPGSRAWRDKLEPLRDGLEGAIADKAGAPYEAREVAFDMPEFIDIVLNAGDSRQAKGATIGQSLPNWGPVADAGGRTVVMSNLIKSSDADSLAVERARVDAVFCPDSAGLYTQDAEPILFTTILHEAAHNLGPAQNYQVDGRSDEDALGGPMSAVFEELKAQTASLYLTDWLAEEGVIEADFAAKAHFADVAWAFGQIADGFASPDGGIRAYGQLAAIQVGYLLDAGALTWKPDALAANGSDKGCFEVGELEPAIDAMASEVFSIKATLDADRARALRDAHVTTSGDKGALWDAVAKRWHRSRSATYVYAVSR